MNFTIILLKNGWEIMILKCIRYMMKEIRTLKNKIYKYMTAISKNMYINKLDDTVDEDNNTYRSIKMKPIDVKDNTYIDFEKEVNDKDPKIKVW